MSRKLTSGALHGLARGAKRASEAESKNKKGTKAQKPIRRKR